MERAFERAIDAILAQKPDLVLHAGDVFHHTRPTWHAMRIFLRQMRRLEQAGIPVVIIAGFATALLVRRRINDLDLVAVLKTRE